MLEVKTPNLDQVKVMAVDTETKDPLLSTHGPGDIRKDGNIIGVSIACDNGFKEYYPIAHESGENCLDSIKDYLQSIFNVKRTYVGANIRYDIGWLHSWGVSFTKEAVFHDIQLVEALLDEEKFGGYSLDNIAKSYLGYGKDDGELNAEALRRGINPKSEMYKMEQDFVRKYAIQDAVLPLLIYKLQMEAIRKENLTDIYNLENDLIMPLFRMRTLGVAVDCEKAEALLDETYEEELGLLKEIHTISGREINPMSSADLASVFDALGIKYSRTVKGNPSFTSPNLLITANNTDHKLPSLLVDYRLISKMRKDFIKGAILDSQIKGRVHPLLHQTRSDSYGSRTGRLSCSNPNLQQMPARNPEWLKKIRGLIIPDTDKLAAIDYSQQEPRVLVHYAGKYGFPGAREMVKQYNEDMSTDFHQAVADIAEIDRKQAKTVNLGMFYGMGPNAMAIQLGMPRGRANVIFEKYHNSVPFVRMLSRECMRVAEKRGYIKTLLGRHKHFNLWEPANNYTKYPNRESPLPLEEARKVWEGKSIVRAFTYRALNALIQGSSADMMKKAIIDLDRAGYNPQITIHDEIVLSISSEKEAREASEIMCNGVQLDLPILSDIAVGPNWGEVEDI